MDVHKRVLMVVVVSREAPEVVMAEERFLTARRELKKLAEWLEEQGVEEVVMESTAQYWWPVWVELEERYRLHLAQARSNRGPRGRKTDFQDACRLARRFVSGDLSFSFVPGVEQRELEQELSEQLKAHAEQVRRLTEMPGINVVAAQHLIAEIGPQVAACTTPGQLASWAGVCPGRQESGGESRSNRSPKGNRYVRALICQIAHAATRTKGSYWGSLYQRWVRRMAAGKALWAVAHRLLRLIWKLLHHGVDYRERGPRQMNPLRLAARMRRLRAEFRRYGYDLRFTPAHEPSTA